MLYARFIKSSCTKLTLDHEAESVWRWLFMSIVVEERSDLQITIYSEGEEPWVTFSHLFSILTYIIYPTRQSIC